MFWENIYELLECGPDVEEGIEQIKQRHHDSFLESAQSMPAQISADELERRFIRMGKSLIYIGDDPSGMIHLCAS